MPRKGINEIYKAGIIDRPGTVCQLIFSSPLWPIAREILDKNWAMVLTCVSSPSIFYSRA